MYKLCKTEQSTARQRQLEQGLLKLLLRRRYEDISVSDLCSELGLPRKSFYRYFSSKDGALYALLDHTMMAYYEEGFSHPDGIDQLADLGQFFVFWYAHRDLIEALDRSQLSGLLVERATALVQREKLMPSALLNMPVDVQSVSMAFAVCGLLSMVIQWHKQGYNISAGDMTRIAKEMLTRPLIRAQ